MSPDIHRFAVPPGPRYSDSHTTCSLRKSPVMAAMAMAQCWDPWPYDSSDSKKQGDPSSHRILRTSECVGGGIPHFVACKNPDLGPNQIRLQSKPLGCIASELSNSYATIAIIHNYSPVCCLYNPSVLTTYSWLQVHSIPMFAGISSPDTVGGKSQCGDVTTQSCRGWPPKKIRKGFIYHFFSHRKKKETAFPGWFVDFMRSPYSFQVTSTASFWTV